MVENEVPIVVKCINTGNNDGDLQHMTNEEILNELKQNGFFLADGRCNPQSKRKLSKFPDIEEKIRKNVPFFSTDLPFAQIVHALKHNISSLPKCPVCNNNLTFDRVNSSYPKTCSVKCGAIHSPHKTFKNRDVTKEHDVFSKRISNRMNNYRTGSKSKLNDQEWLQQQHVDNLVSIVEIANQLEVTPQTVKNALVQFGIESPSQQQLRESSNIRKYGVKNPGLLPTVREKARKTEYSRKLGGWTSTGEQQVFEFIKSVLPNAQIIQNTQRIISPYELDIYLPEYKLAIEYCGLYWHSDLFKKDNYHSQKQKQCAQQGIRLITLFEDEWNDKQQLVQTKLKNILGVDDREVVYARNTKVVPISVEQKKSFLEQNHIQGMGRGSVSYGLVDNAEKLVAIITFFKRATGEHELNRFATSKRVIGGFTKLLSHFKNNNDWNTIVSFADLRWSEGNIYQNTGWEHVYDTRPDYYWVKNGFRYHKFRFRHKHLPMLLDVYDPTLSEHVNCKNNGYNKIYNCGLSKFMITNR